MKAKTLLELVTLSTTLYTISKETHLMEKLTALSEQGKDKINDFMNEKVVDEHGNEVQFLDRLVHKAKEAEEELEVKIGEMIASFYEKVNIAHTDQLKGLELKVEQLEKELALAEARINHLEQKTI
jgi:polyhydroxyalkanoate synthesis regulator phasin